jgi:hypothetical protein
VAHVELSLSEAFTPATVVAYEPEFDSFSHWTTTVIAAAEPCLLIDSNTIITAISPSCCLLFALGLPPEVTGRSLLGEVLRLLDFTANRGELPEQEAKKIPPLLALSSGRLARGLLRVETGPGTDADTTVDAIATPLLRGGQVAGSLTFFASV